MTWEVDRHDWTRLRGDGSVADIPQALKSLVTASSDHEAKQAYWRIENTVVVQGRLFEAAPATAACAVIALHACSSWSRSWLLELLIQLGAGEPDADEVARGNASLTAQCLDEVRKGVGAYLWLLEAGDETERAQCVDLLALCCGRDPTLVPSVRWYFERLLRLPIGAALAQTTRTTLAELPNAT